MGGRQAEGQGWRWPQMRRPPQSPPPPLTPLRVPASLSARCTHARPGGDAERDGGAACTAPTVGLLPPIKEGPTGTLLPFYFLKAATGGRGARQLGGCGSPPARPPCSVPPPALPRRGAGGRRPAVTARRQSDVVRPRGASSVARRDSAGLVSPDSDRAATARQTNEGVGCQGRVLHGM